MSEQILSFDKTICYDSQEGNDVVSNLTQLTKESILAFSDQSKLAKDYRERAEIARLQLLAYASETGHVSTDRIKTYEGFKKVISTNTAFQEQFFSVVTQVLDKINSVAEIQEAMQFVDVKPLGQGDSALFDIGSKTLYNVEEVGYGDLGSQRFQYTWYDQEVLLPKNYDCAVAMDVYQSATQGFDIGRMIAKVAVSQRAKMHKDVFDKIFSNKGLVGTPFLKSTFDIEEYQKLARDIQMVNGGNVFAFGTAIAFSKMSRGIDSKFTYQNSNEYLKTGMIGDLYGIQSMVLDNAINPSLPYSATSTNPMLTDDRLVLMSTNVPDKLAKMVIEEGQNTVLFDNGSTNNIQLKTFKVRNSWNIGLISQAVRGLQIL